MSDNKPVQFRAWVDPEDEPIIHYGVQTERLVADGDMRRRDERIAELTAQAAELQQLVDAMSGGAIVETMRSFYEAETVMRKQAEARAAELERDYEEAIARVIKAESAYDESEAQLARLHSLADGYAGAMVELAEARLANRYLEGERDRAQTHAARLREALKFYANNDDVIFRTDDGGKVAIAALSATPADALAYLAALETEHAAAMAYYEYPDLDNGTGWRHALAAVEAAKAKGGERS